MPLTEFQRDVAESLAPNRTPDSYLAGGAALHLAADSRRYSNDLDYFQDSEERVASAFQQDRETLERAGYELSIQLQRPGFVRALVRRDSESTKVEWAHDSAWRFLPAIRQPTAGYTLQPIDLALNKVLALAGRDEPRDFLDVIDADRNLLALGALCWAAVGKDPGFTPRSLLSLIRRRGKYRPEDFSRLHLDKTPDLVELKERWLAALENADETVHTWPPDQAGCLYYSTKTHEFVSEFQVGDPDIHPHFGRQGGILPSF